MGSSEIGTYKYSQLILIEKEKQRNGAKMTFSTNRARKSGIQCKKKKDFSKKESNHIPPMLHNT